MRDISSALESAITTSSSYRMYAKIVIDPSRTFFDTAQSRYPFDTDSSDYKNATDEPVGQCMFYSSSQDKVYTIIVDPSTGSLYGMENGSSTKHQLYTGDVDAYKASSATKPGAIITGSSTATIYYWHSGAYDTAGLYSFTLNLSTWGVSDRTYISIDGPPSSRWSIVSGSPTAISETQLVLCYYTSKGGTGVAIKDGNDWWHWDERFISPNTLTAEEWSIYTTAVAFQEYIYVYATDLGTGEVRALKFDPYAMSWSDLYIALPSDSTRFDVSNAIVANGYVHIAGQFHRTGDFAGARKYALVLRSPNGEAFSWDRFTLLSNESLHFGIDINTTSGVVYASDRNIVGTADASYYFMPTPTGRTTFEPPNSLIQVSADDSSASVAIAAADESNMTNAAVAKNNRATLYFGYDTSAGIEYVKYNTYIIDKVSLAFADGKRQLALNMVPEGIWKTGEIAFPFYAEILSKSSFFDDCDELDQCYVVPCVNTDGLSGLVIDFWNSEEWDGEDEISGVPYSWSHPPESEISTASNYQSETDQLLGKTINLNLHPLLLDYPTITGVIEAHLYGWETGTTSGRDNNTWTLYAVTAPEDDLTDKTVTTGVCLSTYQKFYKESYTPSTVGGALGSLPIVFEFSVQAGTSCCILVFHHHILVVQQ